VWKEIKFHHVTLKTDLGTRVLKGPCSVQFKNDRVFIKVHEIKIMEDSSWRLKEIDSQDFHSKDFCDSRVSLRILKDKEDNIQQLEMFDTDGLIIFSCESDGNDLKLKNLKL
jgi:hypothetical protein